MFFPDSVHPRINYIFARACHCIEDVCVWPCNCSVLHSILFPRLLDLTMRFQLGRREKKRMAGPRSSGTHPLLFEWRPSIGVPMHPLAGFSLLSIVSKLFDLLHLMLSSARVSHTQLIIISTSSSCSTATTTRTRTT